MTKQEKINRLWEINRKIDLQQATAGEIFEKERLASEIADDVYCKGLSLEEYSEYYQVEEYCEDCI